MSNSRTALGRSACGSGHTGAAAALPSTPLWQMSTMLPPALALIEADRRLAGRSAGAAQAPCSRIARSQVVADLMLMKRHMTSRLIQKYKGARNVWMAMYLHLGASVRFQGQGPTNLVPALLCSGRDTHLERHPDACDASRRIRPDGEIISFGKLLGLLWGVEAEGGGDLRKGQPGCCRKHCGAAHTTQGRV